ncbi:MAG: FAD-dependent oxidoreductase [Pseudohongiella sp.]|nr:FAD-dependent oxidoreductase [Pseudohongiella sp.]
MTTSYSTDIVIFGGGIAGLWLLNRARDEGYQAILLETNALGGGQTLASQGIIHGGLKYALGGTLTGAANVIADMPAYWRRCLNGSGDVDLRACRVLSESYYMWSDSGLRSKLKTFLGSKSLQGRVEAVAAEKYPGFFKASTVSGSLYELPDFVVDTASLLEVLANKQRGQLFQIGADDYLFNRDSAGKIDSVTITSQGQEIQINTQRFIFSAGEGNQGLIEKADLQTAKSQIRPLKMTYLKKKDLPPVFVHCIGDSFSLTPKLTITSHVDSDGLAVWYLGGELAESGVNRNDDDQIETAKALIQDLFPWLDFSGGEWHCFTINRAEADINNNYRPEDAYFVEEDNILVAWPTKLTLTPSLADKVMGHFARISLCPSAQSNTEEMSNILPSAELADAYWE